jgi:hypothetical protein
LERPPRDLDPRIQEGRLTWRGVSAASCVLHLPEGLLRLRGESLEGNAGTAGAQAKKPGYFETGELGLADAEASIHRAEERDLIEARINDFDLAAGRNANTSAPARHVYTLTLVFAGSPGS